MFNFNRALYGGYLYDGARYLGRRIYNSARARVSSGVNRRISSVARRGAKAALNVLPYGKYVAPFVMDPRRGRTTTGFFSGKRMKMRKMRKITKRRYKKAFKGVQFAFERNGIVTDGKCVYAEHCTLPITNIIKYTVYALLKNLLIEGGINFSSFDEPRFGRLEDGDILAFSYKTNVTAAPISVSHTVVVGNVTYGDIADALWTVVYNSLINISGGTQGMMSNSLLFALSWLNAGGGNKAELNLRNCKVSIMTKSSLKMQNRTYNTDGDQEWDDINNVPLYGKSYQGTGNGLVPRDYSNLVVPCTSDYGWNTFGPGTLPSSHGNALQEPPEAYHFEYAKLGGKVSIQPGRIKTSVLTGNLNISLDRLFRLAYSLFTSTAADTNQYHSLGKVRMFALERAIAPFAGEVTPAISLACEHDFKGWITLSTKNGQYTAPSNIVL